MWLDLIFNPPQPSFKKGGSPPLSKEGLGEIKVIDIVVKKPYLCDGFFIGSNMNPTVLDPCCGSRMMWFDKQDQRVLFGDQRTESHVLSDGRALVSTRSRAKAAGLNRPLYADEAAFQLAAARRRLVPPLKSLTGKACIALFR